jgi:hypothetical protein
MPGSGNREGPASQVVSGFEEDVIGQNPGGHLLDDVLDGVRLNTTSTQHRDQPRGNFRPHVLQRTLLGNQ